MQRIPTLLQKLTELSHHAEQRSVIDIDLMLDYTRVLYADLLEWRGKMTPVVLPAEPTLEEVTAAMEKEPDATPIAQKAAIPTPAPATYQPPAPSPEVKPMAPPPARPYRRPIQELIGINDKYQFISVLFSNDQKAYEQLLDRINAMDHERQALQWLQAQHWDPEQAATISFYSLISQYFSGR